MSVKRRKIQLELAFEARHRSEAAGMAGEGTATDMAKRPAESPAENEQLMKEIVDRGNLKESVETSPSEPRERRRGSDDPPAVAGVSPRAMAGDPRTTVERELSAASGEKGGNPEAGRRGAPIGRPDGAGSIHPAGAVTGLAKELGRDVFRVELRVSPGPLGTSGGGSSAAIRGAASCVCQVLQKRVRPNTACLILSVDVLR